MRLVVCVDRDDDIGRKTGLHGPIIGRTAVLEAAGKLGTADPEDTDTNALFGGLRLYDELRERDEEVEVIALTGSAKVGVVSDRLIAEQLDQVLKDHPAEAAYFVSDGAEDEYLLPILASRIRIDGVRRVVVRQAPGIESTYYTVTRALKDPKLRAKTVLPFAMVLIVLGLAAAAGQLVWGFIGLLLLIGVYLIFWTFDVDEAIIDSITSASADIRQGAIAFGFGLFAIGVIGAGFLEGYNAYLPTAANSLDRLLSFFIAAMVWWLVGGMIWETGRAIRRYVAKGHIPRSYPIAVLSIVSLGFVAYGITYLVGYIEGLQQGSSLPLILGAIAGGLAMLVFAGFLTQYLKNRTAALSGTAAES
jgi:putative membrane protein